jgi:hypothetical protein
MNINIEKLVGRARMKTYSNWEYDSLWGFNMSYFIECFSKDKINWNLNDFLYDR